MNIYQEYFLDCLIFSWASCLYSSSISLFDFWSLIFLIRATRKLIIIILMKTCWRKVLNQPKTMTHNCKVVNDPSCKCVPCIMSCYFCFFSLSCLSFSNIFSKLLEPCFSEFSFSLSLLCYSLSNSYSSLNSNQPLRFGGLVPPVEWIHESI